MRCLPALRGPGIACPGPLARLHSLAAARGATPNTPIAPAICGGLQALMQEAIAAPEILFIAVGTPPDEDGRADLQVVLAVADFQKPDRIVMMDVSLAKLTNAAANALLATKISFMNELANLAERLGADIERVRIGNSLREKPAATGRTRALAFSSSGPAAATAAPASPKTCRP